MFLAQVCVLLLRCDETLFEVHCFFAKHQISPLSEKYMLSSEGL